MRYHLLMHFASLAAMACLAPSDAGGGGNPNNSHDDFSLADLADLDVSEIAEIRFEQLPAGVYEFEIGDAKLEEGVDKDGAKRFNALFPMKVLAVKAVLEPGVDKESLEGKLHTEKFFINPGKPQEEVEKAIGRIRAFVSDTGQNSAGKLGAIVENSKGHVFTGKIVKQVDKEDKSVSYARLKLDAKK